MSAKCTHGLDVTCTYTCTKIIIQEVAKVTFFDIKKCQRGLQIKSYNLNPNIFTQNTEKPPKYVEKMYFMHFYLFCPGDLVTFTLEVSVAFHADILRFVTCSSPRMSAQRTGHFRSLAVSQ